MIFDMLDRRMRVFETAADYCVLPGIYMVARLDGRSFTRLTKEGNRFEAPFDVRFRDSMVQTAEGLMNCGFRVTYAYTESDEISLLLALDEEMFGRKLRKYDSTLAGEASSRFSLALNQVATFDCRISQLPSVELVVDYFRWRNEDAARNALNAYCYWTLRKQGLSEQAATSQLEGLSVAAKNELLFQGGTNFNDIPKWQKRGVGLYWETYGKPGYNPLTASMTTTRRRRIAKVFELPMKDEYGEFVRQRIMESAER
jgi:tRNA(His) 5'-end guanylyltransferase